MFVSGCEVPLRATHRIGGATGDADSGGTILRMPAGAPAPGSASRP